MAGVALAGACLFSTFCTVLYQQPPGVVFGTKASPGRAPTIQVVQPAGKRRARLVSGSLIVSHGDLGGPSDVKVTLGYLSKAGWQAVWMGPEMAWRSLTAGPNWRYHFYKEHVQVQLYPLSAALVLPWAARWVMLRRRPRWACGRCGYDLRGTAGAVCPECGGASAGGG